MTDKQRYYASLERQRAAESSLRAQSQPTRTDGDDLEELYADMGVRAFAAFQSCLDWLAGIGSGRRTALGSNAGGQEANSQFDTALHSVAGDLTGLKEQINKIEAAVGNLEAGMRRIDKYTLDAFRQLAEMDTGKTAPAAPESAEPIPHGNRRLAKEEARRLALDTARKMAAAGQTLSLASVAREAGLKYGQIVYAFGNKDNFLHELEILSGHRNVGLDEQASTLQPEAQHEVAVTGEVLM